MSERFPLLAQLRADRERAEDEISAPHKETARQAWAISKGVGERLRALERALGTDVAKHLAAEFAHDLASMLRRAVFEAMAGAGLPAGGLVSVVVESDRLRFGSPGTWEAEVLDKYRQQALPACSLSTAPVFNAKGAVDVTVQRVTISVPVLNVTRDIMVDR